MEHPRPQDDREAFERHPDIRGLEGPKELTRHRLDGEIIDLFDDSRDILKFNETNEGDTLRVTFFDEHNERTLFFVKRPEGSLTPWHLRTLTADGELHDEPANVHGSGIPGSSALRLHIISEGMALVYATVRYRMSRSTDELPIGSPWRDFLGNMGSPYDIPEDVQDSYLLRKLLAIDDEGLLCWSFPEGDEKYTGPIISAEIVPAQR